MKRNSLFNVFVLIIIMAMLVSLTACGKSGVTSTPEEAAENFVVGLFTANPEKIVNCIPDFALTAWFGQDSTREEIINDMRENITEDDICECIIISCEKEDVSAMLDVGMRYYTCEELLNDYIADMKYYGATSQDLALIDEYCIVSVNSEVDGEERTDFIFCINYDGEWYALDIY